MASKRTNPTKKRIMIETGKPPDYYQATTNQMIKTNPDTEAPEDLIERRKRSPRPSRRGSMNTGFKLQDYI